MEGEAKKPVVPTDSSLPPPFLLFLFVLTGARMMRRKVGERRYLFDSCASASRKVFLLFPPLSLFFFFVYEAKESGRNQLRVYDRPDFFSFFFFLFFFLFFRLYQPKSLPFSSFFLVRFHGRLHRRGRGEGLIGDIEPVGAQGDRSEGIELPRIRSEKRFKGRRISVSEGHASFFSLFPFPLLQKALLMKEDEAGGASPVLALKEFVFPAFLFFPRSRSLVIVSEISEDPDDELR